MRLHRHDSMLGSWELAVAAPDPRLAPFVAPHMGWRERSPSPVRRREVPEPLVTLIVNLGPPLGVAPLGRDDAPPRPRASFVAGLQDTFAVTEQAGRSEGIEVRLDPLAAHMLLGGRPMHELKGDVVALEDLLGRGAAGLVERLREAPDWRARFELIDLAVARRLADASRPSRQVAWAWHELRRSGGRARVEALAGELGWSRKRLSARFREQVGLTPKTAARVVRFRRAVERLERDDGSRAAEIALDCGYFDQAHLNREFRDLAGTTPLEYVARRLPGGLGNAADGDAFVQDVEQRAA